MLKRTVGPIVLFLINAPLLSKTEIARFFNVVESEFDVGNEEIRGNYKLTVFTTGTAIKMFQAVSENQVL